MVQAGFSCSIVMLHEVFLEGLKALEAWFSLWCIFEKPRTVWPCNKGAAVRNYWLSCDHGQLVRSTEWCAVQSQDFSDFDMIWYDSVFGLLWQMLPRYPRPLRALIEIRWVHPLDRVFSGAQLSPDGTVQVHGRQRIHCRWQCEPWLQYLGRNQGGGDCSLFRMGCKAIHSPSCNGVLQTLTAQGLEDFFHHHAIKC